MSSWVTLAACAVAAAAVVWYLRRSPAPMTRGAEVQAFVQRLAVELAMSHPEVLWLGMLPGRFACLLRVDGQETVVGLHDTFRLAQAVLQPDGFSRLVAGLVADVREEGLDRVGDLDFAAAAPLLLPQVRSRQWCAERGSFGGSGLVQTPMNDELAVVYVVDDPSSMVFVCREHLRRWRKDAADLHNLALANLARRGAVPRSAAARETPVVMQSGDGFDAARVLLLEQANGLLVAIPDRDTLWIGSEDGQDLGRLMATTEAIASRSPHPVSPRLFRITDGRIAPLAGSH